ncbi:DICT sensory domain-containing protein [Actinoplanes sp. NPDC004185]
MIEKRLTKSTLVTVSHAIEQAALAVAEDGPMVVIALFQRLPYFEREREVYERIAKLAAVAVIGVVATHPPELPAGPYPVLLHESEPLAREWTVAVLTPRFGAVLVAHDREEVDPAAATLEAGRVFDGDWRFRRDDALHEVLRLRQALADRLPESARAAIDDVVQRVRHLPATPGEGRADAAVRLLAERTDRDRATIQKLRAPTAVATPGGRHQAALTDEAGVRRWSGADGVTASGTLPVALLGVRPAPVPALPEQTGRRTMALRNEGLIAVLAAVLRPADRITRLDEDSFLLVMPALPYDDAVKLAYRVGTELAAAGERNPFLPPAATVVVAVTRDRPLPLDAIRDGLTWAVGEGIPVATLPSR